MNHRNLDGFRRMFFGGLPVGKKSLEEIFFEMLLTQEIIYHSASINMIFKENPYQNTQQYVALQVGFIGDRLTGSTSKR